jgi:hypothetical protein
MKIMEFDDINECQSRNNENAAAAVKHDNINIENENDNIGDDLDPAAMMMSSSSAYSRGVDLFESLSLIITASRTDISPRKHQRFQKQDISNTAPHSLTSFQRLLMPGVPSSSHCYDAHCSCISVAIRKHPSSVAICTAQLKSPPAKSATAAPARSWCSISINLFI